MVTTSRKKSQNQRYRILLFVIFISLFIVTGFFTLFSRVGTLGAAADLTVEIIGAYNLVVDSNVSSPSTYAPSVATVAGRFCNVGDTDLTDVQGFIGDGANPGIYPARDSTTAPFIAEHPHLANSGDYAFTHVGGQLGTGDASRFIGTIPAGECRLQYWHFSYPQCENGAGGAADLPPCDPGHDPVWGDTNVTQDDLWLTFDIWGTATGETGSGTNNSATQRMTMRNEISAMANKIRPNPDGRWFNTNTSQVLPGDVITSNGILYTLGNIRHGFDNDGDFIPDYNAWVQPIGDPSYDPSCFRLIRTSGVLTVSRAAGQPDLIIPFDDSDPSLSAPYGGPLYFTNLPDDNTAVDGEVFYTFMALNGPCVTGLTPYQEVASGYDNEKFNGDYGTGIPPIVSLEPAVTIDKSSNPDFVNVGQQFTYQMPVVNTGSTGAGLPLSTGNGGMPLVISDTIPTGLNYVTGSASFSTSQTGLTANILFSTDNGVTWSSTEPVPASTVTTIQWWLSDTFDPNETATTSFTAVAPSTPPSSFIENCADSRFGDGSPFAEACEITVIQGPNQLGNFVWRDDNGDGIQDAGEPGIDNVTLTLFWDRNGDGVLDSGDVSIDTIATPVTTTGTYSFTNLPDGKYIVVVDENDPDIPTGYRNTTPTEIAVDLDSGGINAGVESFWDADFGFGPSLAVNKTLVGGSGFEANEVTYIINVNNLRPGGGEAVSPTSCRYTVWSTVEASQSAAEAANKRWANPLGAFNADGPDGVYAASDYGNSLNQLAATGFNISPQAGNITSVEVLFSLYHNGAFNPDPSGDDIQTLLYFNGIEQAAVSPQTTTGTPGLDAFGPGQANQGLLVWNVSAARTWAWTDFPGDLDVEIDTLKEGGVDGAIVYVDAIGFRITSDQACAVTEADDILATVPLTDTYDTSLLQFISAQPPETSVDTINGLISWSNIGPISPGQTKSVQVTFLALEPSPEVATTVNNSTCATASQFGDGLAANDDCDTATGIITPTTFISGTVWSDLGNLGWTGVNGYEPGTDLFIEGVTVRLWRCDGLPSPPNYARTCTETAGNPSNGGTWVLAETTTTDANGRYLFDGLVDGFYYVEVVESSIPGSPSAPSGDADADANTSHQCTDTNCVTTDSLWQDPDADLGNMIKMSYADDGDAGSNDSQGDVTQRNFGYDLNPAIYGTVWHDVDGDGIQETGENGLGDGTSFVDVYLDDCGVDTICGNGDDGPTIMTTTNISGYYEFLALTANNTYQIRVDAGTLPAGGTWTQTDDPDATLDDQHIVISIPDGQISGSHDFGYTQTGTATIGDTVYTDWNGNGSQDGGDSGLANVDVTLYVDIDNDGTLNVNVDAVYDTLTTDASGYYTFTVPGTYTYFVVIDETDIPGTYVQTADPETGTNDGRSRVENVTNGSNHPNEDFGYQPTGYSSIGDLVWQDSNGNGVQDVGEIGLPDITVSLYHDANNNGVIDAGDALVITTTTDANGGYLFDLLPAGDYLVLVDGSDSDLPTDGYNNPFILSTGSNPIDVTLGASETYLEADFGFTAGGVIGDFIWQDNNGDGQPDNSEPGINGITVRLFADTDGNGTPDVLLEVDVTADDPVTGAPGYYEFTGLPAGNYVVVIDPTTVPAGFVPTGDPDENSPPACVTCDEESALYLALGQIDRSRDFGYQPTGVIGDAVWIDTNGDGIQDPGEPGIPAITVELLDGVCIPGSNCPTVETDADGYYSFGNLPDGTYTVVVDITDPDFPLGLSQTYDPDEANPCAVCDSRGSVTLPVGGSDLTIDFGYQFRGTNSIAGSVYHDDNNNAVQEGSETNTYEDVTIYLWNCGVDATCSSGVTLVGTMLTDSNGNYLFDNLGNGNYLVSVNANAPSVIETDPTVTSSPTTIRLVASLGPNQDLTDQDFGFLSPLDLGDLPDSYRTSLADDGPRHVVINTLYLGALVEPDLDANGQMEPNAGRLTGGDDGDGIDDEDGVNAMTGNNWGDGIGEIQVDVVGSGCLIGWIDWNDNGTFDAGGTVGGVSEVLVNQFVTTGVDQQIVISSPTTAQFIAAGFSGYNTEMFVRFRLFPPNDARFGNMTVDANGCPTAVSESALISLNTGRASAGEVEDYEWLFSAPTAVTLTDFSVVTEMDLTPFILLVMVWSILILFSVKLVGQHLRKRPGE